LDDFGVESNEAGSYVCSLDGRHFLLSFVVKERDPCPVFRLQSALGSVLQENYENRQSKYQTTAVHKHLSNWSPAYRQNTLYDPEVEFCNVKLLTLNRVKLNVATVTITIHTEIQNVLDSNSPTNSVSQF
jgi:hypothetical protein